MIYDFTWCGGTSLCFFGNVYDVDLFVYAEEAESFSDIQYESYQKCMVCWNTIQEKTVNAILNYYQSQRFQLGYDEIDTPRFPEIHTAEEIWNHITCTGMIIPYTDICELYGGRCVCLTFDCTWDEENGVGVRIVNEEVIEVGYQDIAF